MLYLVLACGVCLLVMWLCLLTLRSLPPQPPLPPAADQLGQLLHEVKKPSLDAVADKVSLDHSVANGAVHEHAESQGNVTKPKTAECTDEDESQSTASPLYKLNSYRWLHFVVTPLLLLTLLISTLGLSSLFQHLAVEHARGLPTGVYVFQPTSYGLLVAIPACLLAVFCTVSVYYLTISLLLGPKRLREYLVWNERRNRNYILNLEANPRLSYVLMGLMLVGLWIFLYLGMNWHARFTEEEIVIQRLFSIGEERHPYDSVAQIVVYTHRHQNGRALESLGLGLRFETGQKWTADDNVNIPNGNEQTRLLEFLQRKTGKPITQVRNLSAAPGW